MANNANNFSEWSTYCTSKAIGESTVGFSKLEYISSAINSTISVKDYESSSLELNGYYLNSDTTDDNNPIKIRKGKVRLATEEEDGEDYIATDWRAYLYMCGLEKKSLQIRPDIYE